jgi:hypothetical protein
MTEPTLPAGVAIPGGRRVLLWRPDSDASQIEESIDHAARFLQAPPNAVVAAIDRGELLSGWFVDWEAGAAA